MLFSSWRLISALIWSCPSRTVRPCSTAKLLLDYRNSRLRKCLWNQMFGSLRTIQNLIRSNVEAWEMRHNWELLSVLRQSICKMPKLSDIMKYKPHQIDDINVSARDSLGRPIIKIILKSGSLVEIVYCYTESESISSLMESAFPEDEPKSRNKLQCRRA